MQYWSWILTAVGVVGLRLAGRHNRLGWAVGLGAQGLWIAYALATRQYGFLFSAVAYGWAYGTNLRDWKKRDDAPSSEPAVETVTVGDERLATFRLDWENNMVRAWWGCILEGTKAPVYRNGIRLVRDPEAEKLS